MGLLNKLGVITVIFIMFLPAALAVYGGGQASGSSSSSSSSSGGGGGGGGGSSYCQNECIRGTVDCYGNSVRTCGDFDTDSCSEYQLQPCTSAQLCSTGKCVCKESWSCTEWSDCSNDEETRTCTDLNTCGTTNSQPKTTRTCGEAVQEAETTGDTPPATKESSPSSVTGALTAEFPTKSNWYVLVGIVAAIIAAVVVFIRYQNIHQEDNSK